MNAAPACKPKYAWRIFPRVSPPKRAAEERAADFNEIYALFDEDTVRAQASRCIQCPNPLCMTGCPLANRIPEWLGLAAEGRFLEAAAISGMTSNMPEICSRVCPQERLCEGACILNAKGDPVSIGAVEKFINEYAFAHDAVHGARVPWNGRRVAVVGAGPGGIACADELAKRGYSVTVFEAMALAGGLLVNGIPSFKLEKRIVERRLDVLRERGVVFHTHCKVGADISMRTLREDYDAVFLAIGAQQPKLAGIPGEELPGVFEALPFLIQKNLSIDSGFPQIDVEGKRVMVLGGGDTAMDCLRTAIRCGAQEAVCVYRRDLANMPGSRKEYFNALEEGARFDFLTNPVAILPNQEQKVGGLRCVRMELGKPDASGRRKPRPIPGSEFDMPADIVLVAYGFDPVPFPANGDFDGIAINEWAGVIADASQATSLAGVFAGGDLVRGPSLVVHAVRDGRKAAQGIHRYLDSLKGAPLS